MCGHRESWCQEINDFLEAQTVKALRKYAVDVGLPEETVRGSRESGGEREAYVSQPPKFPGILWALRSLTSQDILLAARFFCRRLSVSQEIVLAKERRDRTERRSPSGPK